MVSRTLVILMLSMSLGLARAQTAQVGAERGTPGREQIEFEYIHYRPAVCETEALKEWENERPNKGGLIYCYFTNRSDDDVPLAFYRINRKDESHWRLGGFLAWDRLYGERLKPGEMGVLELCPVVDEFSEGKDFDISWVGRKEWKPVGRLQTKLEVDDVRISLIRFLPSMDEIEVHIRNRGSDDFELEALSVEGREAQSVEWTTQQLGANGHAIARIRLTEAIAPSTMTIVRCLIAKGEGEARPIFAHRRAFKDDFPIGTWSDREGNLEELARNHIDLCVRGGHSSEKFFSEDTLRYGVRVIAPSGKLPNVDMIRDLGDHPATRTFMVDDEPDWHTTPEHIRVSEMMTRNLNKTVPTFVNLCRNVKFFEYAPLADIPGHDHYCVTAPSSSKWPKFYGTNLEETAYYTRDLKEASEPKPIWVWSQGVHPWTQRPKRSSPTPAELEAQLLFNLGRGAKGILWFNFHRESAEKFPDAGEAIQHWGRVMHVLRSDLMGSEPLEVEVTSPEKVDVAILRSWDKLLLFAVNQDYEIDPEAYRWTTAQDVKIEFDLPEDFTPIESLEVSPQGIESLEFDANDQGVTLSLDSLEVGRVFMISNVAGTQDEYEAAYKEALNDEVRKY